jgi:hypothetical protein
VAIEGRDVISDIKPGFVPVTWWGRSYDAGRRYGLAIHQPEAFILARFPESSFRSIAVRHSSSPELNYQPYNVSGSCCLAIQDLRWVTRDQDRMISYARSQGFPREMKASNGQRAKIGCKSKCPAEPTMLD